MSTAFKNQDRTNVEKAKDAWGDDCPDWVLVLAEACDSSSQSKVGARLGFRSGAALSAVLANNYKADTTSIEKKVRGELMAATVMCPATGEISLAVCLDNQEHAKGGNRTSAFRARMVMACRKCPISRFGG